MLIRLSELAVLVGLSKLLLLISGKIGSGEGALGRTEGRGGVTQGLVLILLVLGRLTELLLLVLVQWLLVLVLLLVRAGLGELLVLLQLLRLLCLQLQLLLITKKPRSEKGTSGQLSCIGCSLH